MAIVLQLIVTSGLFNNSELSAQRLKAAIKGYSVPFEMIYAARFYTGSNPSSEVSASFDSKGKFEMERRTPPARMKGRYSYYIKTGILELKYDTDAFPMRYKLIDKESIKFELISDDGSDTGSYLELVIGG